MAFELLPIQPEFDIVGFHSIYYFEFDKTFYHSPETHDFWEIVYVDDGCIHAIVDGVGCELHKGQAIFHAPMEQHSHIANHKDTSNLLVISFTCSSPRMSYFSKKIFQLDKASQNILSLFIEETKNANGCLPNEFSNKSPLNFTHAAPGSVQLLQCYLVEFLISLIRTDTNFVQSLHNTQASRRMAEGSMVISIKSYMEEKLTDKPSLSAICNEFLISRSSLCRIFKEETGVSPIEYWIQLKIKKAKRLLREDEYTITQISDLLGYSSIHHFTRMFKQVTGLSPRAYKSSVKQ